jgi:sporulation protein YlmC with PRC-barrel domain
MWIKLTSSYEMRIHDVKYYCALQRKVICAADGIFAYATCATFALCASAPSRFNLIANLGVGIERDATSSSASTFGYGRPQFQFSFILHRSFNMSQLHVFSNSPVKASSVIGTSVVDTKDESLGDIKEIVIDPSSGRVAYAVVSFGGFLGLGEKLFAIPFSAFKYNEAENEYVLDVSKERLKAAPGFDADHWPKLAEEKWNRDVHTYYERPPYWELPL